jgi:hypothetical protein
VAKPSKPKIPRPWTSSKESRESALVRLGVTQAQVEQVPKITHLLKALGGRWAAIEYLRGSEEPEARRFLEVFDSMPVFARKYVPMEAFCLAAGMTTKRMFGLIAQEVFAQSKAKANLLAAANHTRVVGAAIFSAMGPAGSEDRRMLLQHERFLPLPKTQVLNIAGDAQIGDGNRSAKVLAMTSVVDSARRMTDRFNGTNPAKALPEPVDEEEDDEGEDSPSSAEEE